MLITLKEIPTHSESYKLMTDQKSKPQKLDNA
jgi:hypothetical protein